MITARLIYSPAINDKAMPANHPENQWLVELYLKRPRHERAAIRLSHALTWTRDTIDRETIACARQLLDGWAAVQEPETKPAHTLGELSKALDGLDITPSTPISFEVTAGECIWPNLHYSSLRLERDERGRPACLILVLE